MSGRDSNAHKFYPDWMQKTLLDEGTRGTDSHSPALSKSRKTESSSAQPMKSSGRGYVSTDITTASYVNQIPSSQNYTRSLPPTSLQRGPDLSSFRDTTYQPTTNTASAPAQSVHHPTTSSSERSTAMYYESRATIPRNGGSEHTPRRPLPPIPESGSTPRGWRPAQGGASSGPSIRKVITLSDGTAVRTLPETPETPKKRSLAKPRIFKIGTLASKRYYQGYRQSN